MNIIKTTILVGTSLLACGGIAWLTGARVNTSASIPLGLYWKTSKPIDQLARDDIVLLCPPPEPIFEVARKRGYLSAGFCPGDFGYMMKYVKATAGDMFEITSDGVTVNGRVLPNSKPLAADKAGRPLPYHPGTYQLATHQVLLMTELNPASFDSRYFGAVEIRQLKEIIRPIFTW